MSYIFVENDRVPIGNFAFISDVTGNETLFNMFYEAEKNIKIDYMDFARKIRIAFESFAVEEEARRRKNELENENKELKQLKDEIIAEIDKPASILNYKNIIIDLCRNRELEFKEMLVKYSFLRKNSYDDETIRIFQKYIRYIYSFGSESSHINMNIEEKYIPNKENCLRVAGSFHDFLCKYYHLEKKFDSTIVPIRDYIAFPKQLLDKMGMNLDVGKALFVKEESQKIRYYIFSSDIESISKGQRRDIDTVNKLWEENFSDPSNVIRKSERIYGSNGDYAFQVYALPGRPIKLTEAFINSITLQDKLDIISGIYNGIVSLHSYVTPLFHRNINPDAFYIFNIHGKYKTLLAKFDCAKDTDNDAFTVLQNVEKKVNNEKTNGFFAPEVKNNKIGFNIDWEKADIYSLAKTAFFILTGKITDNIYDVEVSKDISEELLLTLMEMMDEDPNKRCKLTNLGEALR